MYVIVLTEHCNCGQYGCFARCCKKVIGGFDYEKSAWNYIENFFSGDEFSQIDFQVLCVNSPKKTGLRENTQSTKPRRKRKRYYGRRRIRHGILYRVQPHWDDIDMEDDDLGIRGIDMEDEDNIESDDEVDA